MNLRRSYATARELFTTVPREQPYGQQLQAVLSLAQTNRKTMRRT